MGKRVSKGEEVRKCKEFQRGGGMRDTSGKMGGERPCNGFVLFTLVYRVSCMSTKSNPKSLQSSELTVLTVR